MSETTERKARWVDHIRRHNAQGATDKEIAEQLGISFSYVAQMRRDAKIPALSRSVADRLAADKVRRKKGWRVLLDSCEQCGMPFSMSAPGQAIDRVHSAWRKKHLCNPALWGGADV